MMKNNWKLPSFEINQPLLSGIENYLSVDKDFLPFNQIQHEANHIYFADLLDALRLPKTAKLAITSHKMTYPTKWHNHDYIEVFFVLEGRLLHLTKETTHVLDSPSFCFIPIGESHLIAPIDAQPTTIVNLLIHPDLFQKITELDSNFSRQHFQAPLILEPSLTNEQLMLNLKTLILHYYKNEYQPTLVTIAHLMTILYSIFDQAKPNYLSSDLLSKACLDLIKKQASTITLKQLAQHLNYSQGHLSRHIRQQTGLTVSQHIAQTKLNKACQLLLESKLSIHEIAQQSGYQSESHFHRIFKKELALTPGQYRKLVGSK